LSLVSRRLEKSEREKSERESKRKKKETEIAKLKNKAEREKHPDSNSNSNPNPNRNPTSHTAAITTRTQFMDGDNDSSDLSHALALRFIIDEHLLFVSHSNPTNNLTPPQFIPGEHETPDLNLGSNHALALWFIIDEHLLFVFHSNRTNDPAHRHVLTTLKAQFNEQVHTLLQQLRTSALHQQVLIAAITSIPIESSFSATAYPVAPTELPPPPLSVPSQEGGYRFYAVRRGRTPGIYTSWPDCKSQVHGISNEYRGFKTLSAAQAYLAGRLALI
jgi:hypothetical protein